MKNAVYMILLAFLTGACDSEPEDRRVGTEVIDIPATMNDDTPSGKAAKITFDKTEFDTGKITQGEVFTFRYAFTNTGDAPLIISSVVGSCGCTVMRSYPKGKILPGEGGEIEVEFDSDNKWGERIVPINVSTNTTPSLTQLVIKTEIIVPDPLKTK